MQFGHAYGGKHGEHGVGNTDLEQKGGLVQHFRTGKQTRRGQGHDQTRSENGQDGEQSGSNKHATPHG